MSMKYVTTTVLVHIYVYLYFIYLSIYLSIEMGRVVYTGLSTLKVRVTYPFSSREVR